MSCTGTRPLLWLDCISCVGMGLQCTALEGTGYTSHHHAAAKRVVAGSRQCGCAAVQLVAGGCILEEGGASPRHLNDQTCMWNGCIACAG
mmetsp:Transcript_9590/g.23755  ORF Transcript_9590/g.23755 Transcript_9590/m.23755 type:complete len:90 (+) Transcript_9590:470-739(+)